MSIQEKNDQHNFNQNGIDLAKRIVLNSLTGHKCRVYFFGSRAKGKPWTSSDIDIAIMPLEPMPTGLLSKIREELEESNILYNVDLIDLSKTDLSFQKKVEEEGILWND